MAALCESECLCRSPFRGARTTSTSAVTATAATTEACLVAPAASPTERHAARGNAAHKETSQFWHLSTEIRGPRHGAPPRPPPPPRPIGARMLAAPSLKCAGTAFTCTAKGRTRRTSHCERLSSAFVRRYAVRASIYACVMSHYCGAPLWAASGDDSQLRHAVHSASLFRPMRRRAPSHADCYCSAYVRGALVMRRPQGRQSGAGEGQIRAQHCRKRGEEGSLLGQQQRGVYATFTAR
jgi:hypothetical protein